MCLFECGKLWKQKSACRYFVLIRISVLFVTYFIQKGSYYNLTIVKCDWYIFLNFLSHNSRKTAFTYASPLLCICSAIYTYVPSVADTCQKFTFQKCFFTFNCSNLPATLALWVELLVQLTVLFQSSKYCDDQREMCSTRALLFSLWSEYTPSYETTKPKCRHGKKLSWTQLTAFVSICLVLACNYSPVLLDWIYTCVVFREQWDTSKGTVTH